MFETKLKQENANLTYAVAQFLQNAGDTEQAESMLEALNELKKPTNNSQARR
jgi:hypothetical protein